MLYFSAMMSATTLGPRNKVFQLCELKERKKKKHVYIKLVKASVTKDSLEFYKIITSYHN